ncbi:MAG: aminotransferase class I/II-fold pyridoxal phosphate-dependent enzyme [Planctomycetota bacterium]
MDFDRLIADRASGIDASGIRRAFELGATLTDPVNLSIGQPDFPVPEAIKRAAIDAIEAERNGYTLSGGIPPLRRACNARLASDLGWPEEAPVIVTGGTSGALLLAALTLLGPDDEIVFADPYFPMYPVLAKLCGAKPVIVDTYPDFRLTAERVAPVITERTKAVLLNSPGNPTGVVATQRDCEELLALCREKNVLLISDEIYDEFTFPDARTATDASGQPACPSPGRVAGSHDHLLVVRGFGKTYGVTGWRMGYAAGPARIIDELTKLQQYTFVCAPSIAQWGCMASFETDMSNEVSEYARRRDRVCEVLGEVTTISRPGGAFYAFCEVPASLGMTGQAFMERCVQDGVILIPGGVFSERDTHVRLSYATDPAKLERGLEVVAGAMRGAAV